jgi:deoxycytidylate deaminase
MAASGSARIAVVNPQPRCPRAPGEGYAKCRTVCGQVGHAEDDAAALAGEHARRLHAELRGHTYYCGPCCARLWSAGIRRMVVEP